MPTFFLSIRFFLFQLNKELVCHWIYFNNYIFIILKLLIDNRKKKTSVDLIFFTFLCIKYRIHTINTNRRKNTKYK